MLDKQKDIDAVLICTPQHLHYQMALDCIAKGDYLINASLDPGLYYIVVDSGNDLPGEYSLTLNITI